MQKLDILGRTIQFGDQVIKDYCSDITLGTIEQVVISLYRKVVELSNGVFINADNGLKGPAMLCFRGGIEAYLSLEYILLEPKLIKQRAVAYYVGYRYLQRGAAKEGIKIVEQGNSHDGKDVQYFKDAIIEIDSELQKNIFNKTLKKWKKELKEDKYLKWYSLHNGPGSVNQLARRIQKKKGQNDSELISRLYGQLSQLAHIYTALDAFYTSSNGSILKPICFPEGESEIESIIVPTSELLISSTNSFIESLYPKYKSQFREFIQTLEQIPLIEP